MKLIQVKVLGIGSKKVLSEYKMSTKRNEINKNEALVFCSFSEFDIPVGKEFYCIKDLEGKEKLKCQIVLKNVTQQFWKPFDFIPQGWKTICLFEFPAGDVPSVVKNLPEINDWYDSKTGVFFVGMEMTSGLESIG